MYQLLGVCQLLEDHKMKIYTNPFLLWLRIWKTPTLQNESVKISDQKLLQNVILFKLGIRNLIWNFLRNLWCPPISMFLMIRRSPTMQTSGLAGATNCLDQAGISRLKCDKIIQRNTISEKWSSFSPTLQVQWRMLLLWLESVFLMMKQTSWFTAEEGSSTTCTCRTPSWRRTPWPRCRGRSSSLQNWDQTTCSFLDLADHIRYGKVFYDSF